ncbi:MAG TPA: ATP-binding protein, partial [Opitutus sp.]|nr:ATP-binding protein [Opitutus sp.]
DSIEPTAQTKGVRLESVLDPQSVTVSGDPARLQQVFWNVLKNAAKFTPREGQIAVSTAVVDQQLSVTVADNGIGMTAEELERVFSPFEQGDHAADGSGQFSGLGLGLSIAHMLIERHSGKIEARSEGRGKGATFTIQLPLAEQALLQVEAIESARLTKPAEPMPLVERSRILLVEDDNSSRTALARLLTRRRFEVVATGSVAEALAAAELQVFEFVVSDIGLPEQDGHVLMKELRQRYGLKGIALTGYGTQEDIATSEAAGFVAHLTKPVSISTLERAIADLRAAELKTPAVEERSSV